MNTNFEDHLQQRYSSVDLFSTQGRIGRKRYFLASTLIPSLLFMSIAGIAGAFTHLGEIARISSYALLAAAILVMSFVLIRITIQRCHDFNKSGWLSVLALIPFANILFSLIPGQNGINQYGETPEPSNTVAETVLFYSVLALFATALVLMIMKLITLF